MTDAEMIFFLRALQHRLASIDARVTRIEATTRRVHTELAGEAQALVDTLPAYHPFHPAAQALLEILDSGRGELPAEPITLSYRLVPDGEQNDYDVDTLVDHADRLIRLEQLLADLVDPDGQLPKHLRQITKGSRA